MNGEKERPVIKVPQRLEEDEDWARGAAWVMTSKGFFPISKLKAAEKKKEKAKSKQLQQQSEWLDQNDLVPYPFEAANLLTLKDNCAYFDACIKQIAKDVVGQGWHLELAEGKEESNQEKERILEFIEKCGGDRDSTFEEALEQAVIDWGMIGWWGWELSRDSKEKFVNGMWHVPAQTIFVHESHNKYCQVRGQKKMWFKRFGLEDDIDLATGKSIGEEQLQAEKEDPDRKKIERANEMIFYKNYYPQSDYYGAPNILSSIGAIIGLIGVRDYNLSFFENYGIPAALIVLEGRWSKDTAKQISDFIDVEIKGSENAHKTMCVHPSKDSKLTYIKLGIEVKEGSFKLYHKQLRDEVLVEYKMPPYRIGIAEVGSLGGSTAAESTEIYAQSVVTPLEETVERLVTKKIFQQGLKCKSYEFQLNELDLSDLDAEAKRDQIYFGLGALTPNQILTRQGKKTYPEGNSYFVSTSYIEIGQEPLEKTAAMLEAFRLVLKGKPKLAAQVLKIAKQEAKSNR